MKAAILSLIFFLFTITSFAQKCNCNLYYDWVKKTFEQNDAGFTFTIATKGQQSYDIHNKLILEKVNKTTDFTECTSLLKDWLSYFRKFHIGIFSVLPGNNAAVNPQLALKSKSEAQLKNFVQNIHKLIPSSLEGIYQTGTYKILVVKEAEKYTGYILSASNSSWKNGDAKFSFRQDLTEGVYFMGDHSAQNINNVKLLDNKYLVLDDIVLGKDLPLVKLDAEKELYYQIKFAESAFITRINNETIYIKLPSFGLDQKPVIDSLASKWKDEIVKAKNLIIDIRNNGGGSDKTYSAILPFIYTNPIQRNQIEFYSSELNNKVWFELLKNPNLSAGDKTLFSDFVNRLNSNKSGFERIFKDNVSVIKLNTVYNNPQHVSVIVNKKTASAAEQFILDAEQSWKVKTFGQQTIGALDIANVTTVNTPDNKLTLVYATSRYITVGKLAIDDVGILPDFYINDEVSEDRWMNFILGRMK